MSKVCKATKAAQVTKTGVINFPKMKFGDKILIPEVLKLDPPKLYCLRLDFVTYFPVKSEHLCLNLGLNEFNRT